MRDTVQQSVPSSDIADWEVSTNVGEPAAPPVAPTPAEPSAPVTEPAADDLEPEAATTEPAGERDRKGRFRHRAQSQRATPDDVKVIGELTKELRAIQAELGVVPKPGESPRVTELRTRLEMARAARDARKGATRTESPIPAPPAPLAAASAFTDPAPSLDEFVAKGGPDPYGDHLRAMVKWELKKEAFDAKQAETAAAATTHQKAFGDWIQSIQAGHFSRLQAYVTANPSAKTVLDTVNALPDAERPPISLLTNVAIQTHPRGPEMVIDLLTHPDVADALMVETDGKLPFDDQGRPVPLVAVLQRRLLTRLSAAQTGSAPARPVPVAPRPPNPVRTGPQPSSDALPGDDSSLEAHEKAFYPSRRRRA